MSKYYRKMHWLIFSKIKSMYANKDHEHYLKVLTLEEKIRYLDARVANLEMSIAPLTSTQIQRIKWISGMLQPKKIESQLIRIGNMGDGGYVLAPPNKNCVVLSLGVGDQISADIELIEKYDAKVYAFDPYVHQPEHAPMQFIFHKIGLHCSTITQPKNLDFRTLKEILDLAGVNPDLALIDIEGSEWGLIDSFGLLSKTEQIVIEFHGLEKIVDDEFFEQISKLLNEIKKTHTPIHVHGNNDGSTLRLQGAIWPGILELTFINNNLINLENIKPNFGPWPTKLDVRNSINRPDLSLEAFFGLNAAYREIT